MTNVGDDDGNAKRCVSSVERRLCQGRRGEAVVFTAVTVESGVAPGQGTNEHYADAAT